MPIIHCRIIPVTIANHTSQTAGEKGRAQSLLTAPALLLQPRIRFMGDILQAKEFTVARTNLKHLSVPRSSGGSVMRKALQEIMTGFSRAAETPFTLTRGRSVKMSSRKHIKLSHQKLHPSKMPEASMGLRVYQDLQVLMSQSHFLHTFQTSPQNNPGVTASSTAPQVKITLHKSWSVFFSTFFPPCFQWQKYTFGIIFLSLNVTTWTFSLLSSCRLELRIDNHIYILKFSISWPFPTEKQSPKRCIRTNDFPLDTIHKY